MNTSSLDRIHAQILWDRLLAVVEAQLAQAAGSPPELLKFAGKSHTARWFQQYLKGSRVLGSKVHG